MELPVGPDTPVYVMTQADDEPQCGERYRVCTLRTLPYFYDPDEVTCVVLVDVDGDPPTDGWWEADTVFARMFLRPCDAFVVAAIHGADVHAHNDRLLRWATENGHSWIMDLPPLVCSSQ